MRTALFYLLCFISSISLQAIDIGVVTLAVGEEFKETVQLGIDNKRAYCKKYGYEFICGEKSLDSSRPIPWSKLLLLLSVMENSSHEWLFWTDADSIVTNFAIPLEDFIDPDYDFILTQDMNGLNTGQFFIRNCDRVRDFFKRAYAHEECIHHIYWEQQGVIAELELDSDFRARTKVVPQRLFNSYAPENHGVISNVTFQPGDFIVHFPGVRDKQRLKKLFQTYASRAVDSTDFITIDSYLEIYNLSLIPLHSSNNEGYMTEAQKKQFETRLKELPTIRSLAEIGLNGGHSMAHFFNNCEKLEKALSFDINRHSYTQYAAEYFSRFHKNQFTFVEGDSLATVPEYASKNQEKYDLIYVDGYHNYHYCLNDIINCRKLAHPDTILWVDDFNASFIRDAVQQCVIDGVIEVVGTYSSKDPCGGGRCWIEARYRFDKKV